MDNFLPLCRDIQKHWIYSNSQYLHLWFEMLLNARFADEPKDDIYKGVIYTINRGEFLFSRITYADRLKISESVVRKCVRHMVEDGMIEQVKSLGKNKPTLYRVRNYDVYNMASETLINKGIGDIPTQSLPSGDQVRTKSQPLKKKDKKDKIDNNVNKENTIPPPIEDVKAYCKERGNNVDVDRWFDFYISKGWLIGKNKMKDWKAAVRTWEKSDKPTKEKSTNKFINFEQRDYDFDKIEKKAMEMVLKEINN